MDKVEKRRTRRNKGTERSKAREAMGLEGPKSRSSRIKYFVRRIPIEARNRADRTDRDPGNRRHTAVTIAELADVGMHELLGKIDDAKVERLRAAVENYGASVPIWMLNRPKDIYTGEGKHLLSTDVQITKEDDVNRMRKIRCYRGIRHETGQKVRGQRTKSTGRTGATVGVKRKKE